MKKITIIIPLVAILLCAGCATDPATGDVQVTVPAAAVDFVTNIVQRGAAAWTDRVHRDDDTSGDASADGAGWGADSGSAESAPSSSAAPSASATASVELDWKFGGFKGGGAKEDSRCRISKLKVGKDSLSLHWDTKIPSDWARDTTGEKGPLIVVAAFYKSGDRWVGGKFDWIDESRGSRSLENIKGGYGGWDGTSWSAAKEHAVCVVSADGKWRSNLIED